MSQPKAPTTVPDPATDRPRADDRPVTLAAVVGAHGITGEVRLKIFAENIDAFASFNGGALTVKSLRHGPKGTIARFAEVTDRNAAEALRGTALTVPRSALPPLGDGEYYHVDLLGLPAVAPDGAALGAVVAVDNYGAGDVLEIEQPDGKRFMVPMIPAAVPEWDAARLVIAEGWVT